MWELRVDQRNEVSSLRKNLTSLAEISFVFCSLLLANDDNFDGRKQAMNHTLGITAFSPSSGFILREQVDNDNVIEERENNGKSYFYERTTAMDRFSLAPLVKVYGRLSEV